MNREKQLVKNTAIIGFGTVLPKFMAVVSLPILTAGLTKSEYGTYDLINILESLLLPCVTLQIQAAAFRFLIDCRDKKDRSVEIVSNVLFFTVAATATALVVLFFCLYSLSLMSRLLVCAYFMFFILKSTEQQIARGMNKPAVYSTSAVVYSAVNVLMIVILVKFCTMGLNGALIALTAASFVTAIMLFARCNIAQYISLKTVSVKTIKEMLAYSWPMIPNSLSMWVMNLSDRLVLTLFLGVSVNAVYAVANKIPSLFTIVQSTFTLAWQESASMASSDDDAGKYYERTFDVVFCLMVGVMALLIAATPILFMLLIRGDYAEAYNQMPILFMGVFFSCIVAFWGGIYVAHKKTKSVGVTTTISAAVNLIVNLFLVHSIGVYAASISTVISYVLLAVYRMYDIQKFQPMKFNARKIFFGVAVLSVMCGLCFMQNMALNIVNMAIAIFVAIYLNKALIVKVLNKAKSMLLKH